MTTIQSEAERLSGFSPLLSIVLPVYNASGKVESTINNLESSMRDLESMVFGFTNSEYGPVQKSIDDEQSGFSGKSRQAWGAESDWYEIIVVNDGSRDDTGEVIDKVASHDSKVRTISYDTNMGKGYAIKRGIMQSLGSYVIFMDGDGEIDAGVLASYLRSLQDADIVIASKYHPDSIVSVPKSRRFLSRCFNIFVKALVHLGVSDTQVGLKAGRGEAFRRIFDSVLVKRYAFDVEMLAVAQLLHLKVVEMPVKIQLDAQFKKKEIARMFLDVLGIVYRLRLSKHYQNNVQVAATK
ncbi:MAG TPA: glycosyltransferase [Nitrososphaera sp.]|nr:glycosyltransferase [Nitrososphaera sp.]